MRQFTRRIVDNTSGGATGWAGWARAPPLIWEVPYKMYFLAEKYYKEKMALRMFWEHICKSSKNAIKIWCQKKVPPHPNFVATPLSSPILCLPNDDDNKFKSF